jgi:hypothetical protein
MFMGARDEPPTEITSVRAKYQEARIALLLQSSDHNLSLFPCAIASGSRKPDRGTPCLNWFIIALPG